jgi:hypothetical protein
MNWYSFAGLTIFILPLLGLICSLLYCIPEAFVTYRKWKETDKPVWFSVSVILGFTSLSLLLLAYLFYIRAYLYYKSYIGSGFLELIAFLFFVYISYLLFIPKTLHFFQKWKKTHKPINFSAMIFFGFMSLYCLSILFVRVLISVLGVFNDGS